jgi:hypothetical protein
MNSEDSLDFRDLPDLSKNLTGNESWGGGDRARYASGVRLRSGVASRGSFLRRYSLPGAL